MAFKVQFSNKVHSIYKFSGEARKGTIKVCEAVFSAMIINKDSKEIF